MRSSQIFSTASPSALVSACTSWALARRRSVSAETERRLASAQEVQAETKADGEAVEKICDDLKSRLPQLQRLENSIEQERKAVSQAAGEAGELRKRLGKNFTEDQVGDLSSPQFPELSDFARQIISFIAEQRVARR